LNNWIFFTLDQFFGFQNFRTSDVGQRDLLHNAFLLFLLLDGQCVDHADDNGMYVIMR